MSPPNLVVNHKLVPELQQEEVTPENIAAEAMNLLSSDPSRQKITAGYEQMRSLLGEVGVCDQVAQEIMALVI